MKTTKPRRLDGQAAAIYSRVSTGEQVGRGGLLSCDAQDATNRLWATEQGLTVVAAYRDEGRTGTNLQRPGWRSLLAAAQRGEFRILVVTYMERLGRGDEFVIAREDLRRAGAHVLMSQESFSDDLGGYLQENMTRTLGGAYAKEISRKTRGKMVAMVRVGLWKGGVAPYGFRTVDATDYPAGERSHPKRLVPDADAARVVADAFAALLATGRVKPAQDALVSGSGRGWTMTQVRKMLASPIYCGRLVWGDIEQDEYCPGIVSRSDWDQAQTMLSAAPREKPMPQRSVACAEDEAYWFAGRAYCGCGARLTPYWAKNRHGRVYAYYECMGARQGLCVQRRVSAIGLHGAWDELLESSMSNWRMRQLAEEAARLAPDTKLLRHDASVALRAHDSARKQVERLTQAIAMTSADGALRALIGKLEEAQRRVEETKRALDRARAEMEAASQPPTARELTMVLSQARQAWDWMTKEEKQQLVTALVDRVTVTDREAGFILNHWADFAVSSVGGSMRGETGAPANVFSLSRTPVTWGPLVAQIKVVRGATSKLVR